MSESTPEPEQTEQEFRPFNLLMQVPPTESEKAVTPNGRIVLVEPSIVWFVLAAIVVKDGKHEASLQTNVPKDVIEEHARLFKLHTLYFQQLKEAHDLKTHKQTAPKLLLPGQKSFEHAKLNVPKPPKQDGRNGR